MASLLVEGVQIADEGASSTAPVVEEAVSFVGDQEDEDEDVSMNLQDDEDEEDENDEEREA